MIESQGAKLVAFLKLFQKSALSPVSTDDTSAKLENTKEAQIFQQVVMVNLLISA
jgi:hypothetical protein